MSEQSAEYSGAQRAALLLMTLGEEEAAEVLKHMDAKEVQRIGTAMASLKNVSREMADQILNGFIDEVEDQTTLGVQSEEYVKRLLTNAFGPGRANAFIDRIVTDGDAQGLDAVKWMSAQDIVDIIDGEHPQIIAIILAYMESDQAAEVINQLPEDQQHEVIMRVARLDDVQQSALTEIENLIASKSTDAPRKGTAKVGGDKVAADIINALDKDKGESILDQIKEKNEELSDRIQDKMFVFDALLVVDDRGIQALLREISNDLLVVALKGCDPGIADKIFNNMSKRAGTLLKEDMEAKGPIRLSEVEEAQKEILDVAKRLADSGDINLGQSSEEYV
ncbi:MAG: flagellar motor switch protein FliG [Gammaproteobacteria bacterium]|nr:flagellar motor switch protein FliG [Gammaproteobacteria bacterium]